MNTLKRLLLIIAVGVWARAMEGTQPAGAPGSKEPIRRSGLFQLEDSAGAGVVSIRDDYEELRGQYFKREMTLETPNGTVVLRDDQQTDPPRRVLSLAFPDGRKLTFEPGDVFWARDLITGRRTATFPRAAFHWGSRILPFDVNRPFKPQWTSKEGKAFRESLPTETLELMEALHEGRKGLHDEGLLAGFSGLFMDLYLGLEDEKEVGSGKRGWELKVVENKYERVQPKLQADPSEKTGH